MNKVKVKIKKLPISNQGSPNFNEMAYQYTSSNPLSFKDLKDSTRMIGEDQYEIGTNYPTEKDPKKANIEAEKGELILTKDFELYKINGKSHAKGGAPLSVNEGDFIFSKKLEGSGKDFNKIFGNFDEKKKYSYADVASRFLKMNDHKVLSTDSNPIDRKTGVRMYEDYKDKLGMLAFLQEVSKGLPNGIPAIAAPMIERLTQAPMGMQPQMPQGPVEGMQLPMMEGQEPPIQEMPTAGQQMMKRGGPILKKYVDGGGEQKLTSQEWDSKYYKPLIQYLQKTYPNQQFNIGNHGDYQRLVTNTPETYNVLKDYYTTDKMKITNKGRKALKAAGVKDADKIEYYSQLPDTYKTDDFIKDQFVDELAGYRGANFIPEEIVKAEEPMVYKQPEQGPEYNELENPDTGGKPVVSNYRNLGYNTNENLAMMNALQAMTSIPYYAPTRMQNYGLQEGMGLASNIMPYNYQSLINEANRSGMRGFQANNAFAGNPNIAAARNAMIAGQLGEQTSKIKGEEYNQNANLYNTNQMQLAQMAGLIGQDKEQQGDLYNTRVVQGRENKWANQQLANKQFIQELVNANNNRTLRNTVDYLMQSRDPNYRFANADLMSGFNQFADPFSYVGSSTPDATGRTSQYIKDFKALSGAGLGLTPADIAKILGNNYKDQTQ
jgi:hypothetical protein